MQMFSHSMQLVGCMVQGSCSQVLYCRSRRLCLVVLYSSECQRTASPQPLEFVLMLIHKVQLTIWCIVLAMNDITPVAGKYSLLLSHPAQRLVGVRLVELFCQQVSDHGCVTHPH